MDEKTIQLRKYINHIEREAQKVAKKETCPICGERQTRFCNSHLVPRFILENISQNGIVLQSTFFPFGSDAVSVEKGIANSGTFHFICQKCDNELFSDYEKEKNLEQYPTNLIMAEIALKNYLSIISKRYKEIEYFNILQKKHQFLENKELMDKQQILDINDYSFAIRRTRKIIDKKLKSGFIVLYWRCLPYVAPLATQSAVIIHRSVSGKVVNDVYDYSPENRMQQVHICIFPMNGKTVVFMFYHKDDRRYKIFEHEFNKLSSDQQLQYINYLVFKNTEEYYCNSTKLSLLQADKELIRLSREKYDSPNLGFLQYEDMIHDYQPVRYDAIPNVLSEQYKIR